MSFFADLFWLGLTIVIIGSLIGKIPRVDNYLENEKNEKIKNIFYGTMIVAIVVAGSSFVFIILDIFPEISYWLGIYRY